MGTQPLGGDTHPHPRHMGPGILQDTEAQGGVCLPDPPVNRITDTCKTLPSRNYVADGKNTRSIILDLT